MVTWAPRKGFAYGQVHVQSRTDQGYEVLVFHATEAGGRTMESLVADRLIDAALDIMHDRLDVDRIRLVRSLEVDDSVCLAADEARAMVVSMPVDAEDACSGRTAFTAWATLPARNAFPSNKPSRSRSGRSRPSRSAGEEVVRRVLIHAGASIPLVQKCTHIEVMEG